MKLVKFLFMFFVVVFSFGLTFGVVNKIVYEESNELVDYIFYNVENSNFALYLKDVEDVGREGFSNIYFPFSSFTSCSLEKNNGNQISSFLDTENVRKVKSKILESDEITDVIKQKILDNNLWVKTEISARGETYEVLLTDEKFDIKSFLKGKGLSGNVNYDVRIIDEKCPSDNLESGRVSGILNLPKSKLDFVSKIDGLERDDENPDDENEIVVGDDDTQVYFNSDTLNPIVLPSEKVEVKVGGVVKEVSKKEIALSLHKITKLKDRQQAKDKLTRVIKKTAKANLSVEKTNKVYTIKGDFKEGDKVYVFIPKSVAKTEYRKGGIYLADDLNASYVMNEPAVEKVIAALKNP